MKNLRYNNICLRALTILCLMMASVGAWAQTYVFITNETNGYFIGLNNGNAVATQTFTTGSCVWTASGTLNNTNRRTLSIGTSYLDGANSNSGTVSIGNNRNGYWYGNNNQLYYYRNANRAVYRDGTQVKWNGTTNLFRIYTSYSTTAEAFTVANITGINDLVTAKGSYNLVSAASYNPTYYTFTGPDTRYWASGYTTGAVTTRPVKTTGFESDTWSLNKTIPGLSINSNTGVLTYNTYVTEDTQVTITHTVRENGQTKTATRTITLKGTIETSLSFASTSLNMTATTLRLPAVNLTASNGSTPPGSVTYSSNNTGCISVSNTGVLTINGAGTATITANYAANGAYLASSATMTITVANTAAFDETVLGEIAITPSSQTLDLGQQVTYTASDKVNSTHRTRPAYYTISTGGNNYYKVGTNYQAAAPTVTENSAPLDFTQMQWSFSGGNGQYYQPSTTSSQSTTELVLTRNTQKTGTTQTFTITATGLYGGWSGQTKTATATVTIPSTQVDLTNLYPGSAINLGVGASENVNTHFTYQPNDDSAGSPYLKFKYTSANTSVATIDASGKVTAVGPGSTTITVTAVKLDGTDGVTCNVTVNVTIDAPTISIDGSGNVTITHPVPGVQIRYTTDGTDPTATTGTVYTASFTASNEQTIKAIAVANGVASAVASEFYATSGVSDGKVILNDYMDHSWTLFQPQINGEENPIYYANPKDVKITYKANGGAVSISESADQFVYYKTLTDDYKYTTIPNPFSKRPRANGNYQGFSKWKITRISGGTITGLAVNSEVNAETELTFNPTNEYGMEVDFEVVWTRAYVVECAVGEVNGNLNSSTLAGDSYETNFIVITSGDNSTTNLTATTSKKVTITMVTPDGATDYRTGTRYIRPQTITLSNDWKFEYINMNNNGNGTTITANNHNLVLGRGISNTSATGVVAGTVQGISGGTNNLNYHMRMESGRYTNVDATRNGDCSCGGTQTVKMTLGCDYDRANVNASGENDNTKLYITDRLYGGSSVKFTDASNKSRETLKYWMKSGTFLTSTDMGSASNGQFYFGISGYVRYTGKRTLIMEGGNIHSISGGLDYHGADNTTSYGNITTSQYVDTTAVIVEYHLRGGHVRGSIYGSAQYAAAKGKRKFVLTGGEINGWVAGGCDGTNTTGGQTYGSTYIYVGGETEIKPTAADPTIDYSKGGNVFGAGSGNSGATGSTATVGRVNNSTLVVADKSYVQRNIYGGGNYGYVMSEAGNTDKTGSTRIYITGGHVAGNVFGGSNNQQGQKIKIVMTGGQIDQGLYGGSNTTGTINNYVTMQINGGQVGIDATHTGNIHGGGYGQPTRVNGNVDLTLGNSGAARDADGVTVWGDVYGGSALGYVNGTAAADTYHTYVTMNAGYIHGSLYGGALGNAGTAANVYGPVKVTVNGGSVFNTDGTGANGSGAVYGANNINGAPQRSVTVDIYGTNSAPAEGEYALFSVYGGGNAADYTYGNGYPKVTVHNCDNSIEYVYGGGNAAAVAATDVTIYGGDKIGNVFGGGNGQVKAANVNGNTNVNIYGGTIGDVYGGSNTNGNIGGTINVNVNAQAEGGHDACPVNIDNVYGGGNKAASAAGNVTIGCAEHIGAVYGGANQANINGNINLSIVSGHIDNVFGGNNTSGNISGTITVTVNDNNSACGMEVGNVYGGGNKAAYGTGTNYPVVNIQNGHLTGSVFGGGLGETAVVTGNPQVTIGQPSTGTVHIDGNVFGGGDAANVVGKPVVVVQNCNTVIGTKDGEGNWNTLGGTVYGGGNAAHVTGADNGTSVTIYGGDINRVFGGGNGEVSPANVEGNAVTEIHAGNIHQAFAGSNMQGNISGSASITVDHSNEGCGELIDEVYGGGNLAAGNAGTVTIDCGAIVGDVYGGANQADINSAITLNITGGTINRVFGGNNTSGNISGAITVNVNKKDACDLDLNYVYGAGNQASYTPSTPGAYPAVNILKGTVKQDVFGGGLGATAVVTSNPTVTVNGGVVSGNVFGGGSEANTVGTTSVTVQAGTVSTDVYGGGALADVEGNTTVAVTGGTVTGNAYGGGLGRLEDAGAGITAVAAAVTGNTTVNVSGGTTGNVFGCNNFNGAPQGTVNVTISNGTVTNNVYGGGNLAAATANPVVTINGGTMQDVFGGGLGTTAIITGNPQVNVTGGTVTRDTYGGGALANVNGNTEVNLTGGTVGSVYGGGLGAVKGQNGAAADVEALVVGNTLVTLNGSKVTGSIFGCNNLNGTPQGHVKVHVLRTIGDSKPHVEAVYGGGNLAAYIPSQATIDANQGFAEVLIENCDNSINYVYGGGNAAPVPATQVTIYGADKIVNAFAGGNGAGAGNPGADIGYLGFKSSGNQTEYGSGVASIAVYGGTVDNVYGGSNTLGYIRNGSQVVVEDAPNDYTGTHCTLNVGNVFGGGNRADMDGDVNLVVGCSEGAEVIYAGASNADVNGNITLTITSGTYGKVFGGNNDSGNVNGSITVNIDETSTCWPVMIGELYGCGNNAAYTTPASTPEPVVNVIACTKIGKVFGGGYGATATVTGNPTVNVNMIKGSFAGLSPTPNYIINNAGERVANSVAYAIPDDYGQIGNIYGGGNAADVIGNTVVNISTVDENHHVSGADQSTDYAVGANILGNVFGGGNVAKVSGNTTVNIGHE